MPSKRRPPPPPRPDSSSSSSSESEEERMIPQQPLKVPKKTTSVSKNPIPPPVAHESSEEEEEEDDDAAEEGSGSEEEEDSSEEERDGGHAKNNKHQMEERPKPQPQPQPQIIKPKKQDAEPSSSYEEGGAESDSETNILEKETPIPPGPSVRTVDPTSKRAALKSSDESPVLKDSVADDKKKRKRKAPEVSAMKDSVADKKKRKRKAPEVSAMKDSVADKKKRKGKAPEVSATTEEDDAAANGHSGKKFFQRLWTEDDEIALLKGMVEFQEKFSGDPSSLANGNFLLEIVKDSLHAEFTKNQLYEKARRLKGKYKTNLGRSENGADPVLSNAHDQVIFDLSKKIWGNINETGDEAAITGETSKKKTRSKANAAPDIPTPMTLAVKGREDGLAGGTANLYPTLHGIVAQSESSNPNSAMLGSFKRALDLVNPSRGKSLEEKWGRQCIAEMKLHTSRSELMKELVDALMEALGPPKS